MQNLAKTHLRPMLDRAVKFDKLCASSIANIARITDTLQKKTRFKELKSIADSLITFDLRPPPTGRRPPSASTVTPAQPAASPALRAPASPPQLAKSAPPLVLPAKPQPHAAPAPLAPKPPATVALPSVRPLPAELARLADTITLKTRFDSVSKTLGVSIRASTPGPTLSLVNYNQLLDEAVATHARWEKCDSELNAAQGFANGLSAGTKNSADIVASLNQIGQMRASAGKNLARIKTILSGSGIPEYCTSEITAVGNSVDSYSRKIYDSCPRISQMTDALIRKHNSNTAPVFPSGIVLHETRFSHHGHRLVQHPVFHDFPFAQPLVFSNPSDMRNLIFSLACHIPLGCLEITVIDQVTSGSAATPANELIRVNDTLLRIVSSTQDTDDVLRRHTDDIARIKTTKFLSGIRDWRAYNKQHPDAPLPWRAIIVFSLQPDYRPSGEWLSLLNGADAGIHTTVSAEAWKTLESSGTINVPVKTIPDPAGASFVPLEATHISLATPADGKISELVEALKKISEARKGEKAGRRLGSLLKLQPPTGDSTGQIEAALGWNDENGNIVYCRVGNTPPVHALAGGKTGCGKSTLLHVIIHSLCQRYSPAELELHLLDFKFGSAAAQYTNIPANRAVWLPHVKSVSLSNDPEYALSTLNYFVAEMNRRNDLFKTVPGIKNEFTAYRMTGRTLPRVLVIIDEVQILLKRSDDYAGNVRATLSYLLANSRSSGIHFLLTTQTISDIPRIETIANHLDVRLAMQLNEGQQILSNPSDRSAHTLEEHHCIVETSGRKITLSFPDFVPDSDDARTFRTMVAQKYPEKIFKRDGRFFHGRIQPPFPEPAQFASIQREKNSPATKEVSLCLGVHSNFTSDYFHVSFDSRPSGNLLIAGDDAELSEPNDDGPGGANNTGLKGSAIRAGLRWAIIKSLNAIPDTKTFYYDPESGRAPFPMGNNVFYYDKNLTEPDLLARLKTFASMPARRRLVIVDNYDTAFHLHPSGQSPVSGAPDPRAKQETAISYFLAALAQPGNRPFDVILLVKHLVTTSQYLREGRVNYLDHFRKRMGFGLGNDGWGILFPERHALGKYYAGKIIFHNRDTNATPAFLPFASPPHP